MTILRSLLNKAESKAPPPVASHRQWLTPRRPSTKRGGSEAQPNPHPKRKHPRNLPTRSMVLTTKPIPIPSTTVRSALSDERIPVNAVFGTNCALHSDCALHLGYPHRRRDTVIVGDCAWRRALLASFSAADATSTKQTLSWA